MDAVAPVYAQAERVIGQRDRADQRILLVQKLTLPRSLPDPLKRTVHPHTERVYVAAQLIQHADVRVIQISHGVVAVERNQHATVADDDGAWHGHPSRDRQMKRRAGKPGVRIIDCPSARHANTGERRRSEEHTSELQSRGHLVCRLLLEKKKQPTKTYTQLL